MDSEDPAARKPDATIPLHNADPLLSLLGFRPTGDLADLTAYTSRRKKVVWFSKAPPRKPPSLKQQRQRNRFRALAQAWRQLTPEQRDNWRRAAKAARLYLTGYSLFLVWQIKRDLPALRTIERHSSRTLIP